MNVQENELKWVSDVKAGLIGAVVVEIRTMTEEEANALMWHNRPIVLIMQRGGEMFAVYPSMDSEGNGAGVLFTTLPQLQTIPAF